MGGADTKLKDVLITEIVPDTQADIDGQLRPGDQILNLAVKSIRGFKYFMDGNFANSNFKCLI